MKRAKIKKKGIEQKMNKNNKSTKHSPFQGGLKSDAWIERKR